MILVQSHCGGVLIESDRETVDTLGDLCHDFLAVSTVAGHSDTRWPSVIGVATAPTDGDWERVVYTSDHELARTLFVDHAGRKILVPGPPGPWRTLHMLRAVRNILRWEAYVAGDLFLHAGMIAINDRGVVFSGAKRTGKTTAILAGLLFAGTRLVANDALTVREEGGRLIGYGWPRSITARRETLLALQEWMPELMRRLPYGAHPTNSWPGPHNEAQDVTHAENVPRTVWLYPAELMQAVDAGISKGAPLTAIVFPQFDDAVHEPVLELLDEATAQTLLAANVESKAVYFDEFLDRWYRDTGVARRRQLQDRVLRTIPFYRLRQNMSCARAAALLVRETVGGGLVHGQSFVD